MVVIVTFFESVRQPISLIIIAISYRAASLAKSVASVALSGVWDNKNTDVPAIFLLSALKSYFVHIMSNDCLHDNITNYVDLFYNISVLEDFMGLLI